MFLLLCTELTKKFVLVLGVSFLISCGGGGGGGSASYTSPGPSPGVSVFSVTNNGSISYIINGSSNPDLTLTRGQTYTFNINATGHPFWIKTSQVTGTDSSYNNGVTNNGRDSGTLTFTVPNDAPSTLFYICQFHSSQVGRIIIISAGGGGGGGY